MPFDNLSIQSKLSRRDMLMMIADVTERDIRLGVRYDQDSGCYCLLGRAHADMACQTYLDAFYNAGGSLAPELIYSRLFGWSSAVGIPVEEATDGHAAVARLRAYAETVTD